MLTPTFGDHTVFTFRLISSAEGRANQPAPLQNPISSPGHLFIIAGPL